MNSIKKNKDSGHRRWWYSDGVLKNFLISRMPIKGFEKSNRHGRNQPGLRPTGRQGELIVNLEPDVPRASYGRC